MRRTLAIAGVAATVLLVWLVPGHQYDFSFDWLVGRAILGGVDPQLPVSDMAEQLGLSATLTQSHPRLPGALLIHPLFGLVSFDYMYLAGRLVTVMAALWLAWLIAKWRDWPFEIVAAVLPLLLLVWPFSDVLATSQWAVFVVAGLIGSTLSMSDEWTSGLPLALAITLKAWPWLLIPALWLAGRRSSAVGATGGFLVLNGAGLLLPNVSIDGTIIAMTSVLPVEGPLNLSPVQWLPLWASVVIGPLAVWLIPRRFRLPASVPLALATSPILWPAYLPSLAANAYEREPSSGTPGPGRRDNSSYERRKGP